MGLSYEGIKIRIDNKPLFKLLHRYAQKGAFKDEDFTGWGSPSSILNKVKCQTFPDNPPYEIVIEGAGGWVQPNTLYDVVPRPFKTFFQYRELTHTPRWETAQKMHPLTQNAPSPL